MAIDDHDGNLLWAFRPQGNESESGHDLTFPSCYDSRLWDQFTMSLRLLPKGHRTPRRLESMRESSFICSSPDDRKESGDVVLLSF